MAKTIRHDSGRLSKRGLAVLALWLAAALLPLLLSACTGSLSLAGGPDPAAEAARVRAAYPEAVPGPDEVVLKWDGTLVTAYDLPAPSGPGAASTP